MSFFSCYYPTSYVFFLFRILLVRIKTETAKENKKNLRWAFVSVCLSAFWCVCVCPLHCEYHTKSLSFLIRTSFTWESEVLEKRMRRISLTMRILCECPVQNTYKFWIPIEGSVGIILTCPSFSTEWSLTLEIHLVYPIAFEIEWQSLRTSITAAITVCFINRYWTTTLTQLKRVYMSTFSWLSIETCIHWWNMSIQILRILFYSDTHFLFFCLPHP